MPARDLFHKHVREALEKDYWKITHDPYPLSFGIRSVLVDIGAEKLLAAEKEGVKIAVEVKSFESPSLLNELEKTIGQLRLYSFALLRQEPARKLYAAIPAQIYKEMHKDPELRDFIALEKTRLILDNVEEGQELQWID